MMASEPNVNGAPEWCMSNYNGSQCLTAQTGENITIATPIPHWLDNAFTITWVSFSLFLDAVSCFVGIVCACLALTVLCQKRKQQCEVSSALFLQRTIVVTDLCFLVIWVCTDIVYNGFSNHVYRYASFLDEANHLFAMKFLNSAGIFTAEVSVWLVTVITIDR